jgi:fibrillarin-like rRNA methylase
MSGRQGQLSISKPVLVVASCTNVLLFLTAMVDILVLGATGKPHDICQKPLKVTLLCVGFTGRLIARYLYAHKDRGSKFTFAVGARSKAKLDTLVSELSLDETVQVILVDVTKPEQVDAAVKNVKVVINTVGPFMRWGTPVVA